ncbi:hypothetical protein ABZX99_33995 [Streptomyces antibioticus]|uniref:hypothetical protein n=1 Tax=Streptomyces antibioticus TaxID=1890 RepID=UPI0033A1EF50
MTTDYKPIVKETNPVLNRILFIVSIVVTAVTSFIASIVRRIRTARTPVAVWDDPTLKAPQSAELTPRQSRPARTPVTSEPKRA